MLTQNPPCGYFVPSAPNKIIIFDMSHILEIVGCQNTGMLLELSASNQ